MDTKLIIAVDGHSSCGKSTFAKLIAQLLQYKYIDSGAMYRAFTLFCLQNKILSDKTPDVQKIINLLPEFTVDFRLNSKTKTNNTIMNGKSVENEIRTNPEVADNVSYISTIPEVRSKMVAIQRNLGFKKGIVMDGRDIGTTVFPQADIKIFMTASVHIRAERRYKELIEKGLNVKLEEIEDNIRNRDFIDSNRDVSPLKKADDAVILDNSNMTPDQQLDWFKLVFQSKIK